MKLAKLVMGLCENDKPQKPINYTVKSFLHFDDGVLNKRGGTTKIKAVNAEEAEKIFREKMNGIWNKEGHLKKIEIISVTKG